MTPSANHSSPNRQGRPPISFREDEDRHAVALLGMFRRNTVNGSPPSERYASMLAAASREGRDPAIATIGQPPTPHLAPTGRRKSPIPAWMKKDRYREVSVSHERNAGGAALENCAQRLRRKHRDWSKPSSPENSWMLQMGRVWAATLYPHAVSREIGDDPERIGRSAAENAGEVEFFEKVLLPVLKQNLVSPENTAFCDQVRFQTF
jgi:hypothetical protein